MVAGNVDGLQVGIYKYGPQGHELEQVAGGDVHAELCAAVYERTAREYGVQGLQYVTVGWGDLCSKFYK